MSDPVLPDLVIEGTKKTVSAREVSKWSMVVAALWIAILSMLKAFWSVISGPNSIFGLDMNEIIYSGLALAAVFSPIYMSIMLDKLKELRNGK